MPALQQLFRDDPLRRTDPTPIGPHTIELPYGGPAMPPESEPQFQGIPWN